ncbi:MAG: hypothetical protein DYH13_06495 [Alphaproteobacteria bacterium PRO2]|nr:hypothetical protein [Alphaproteobacteria bacterium PRO2]
MGRKFPASPEFNTKDHSYECEVAADAIISYRVLTRSLWQRVKRSQREFNYVSQFPITGKTTTKLEEVHDNGGGICTVVTGDRRGTYHIDKEVESFAQEIDNASAELHWRFD